jgi:hypothetical protein
VTSATVQSLTVTGNQTQYGAGVWVHASKAVLLSGLTVHDNVSFGVKSTDSDTTVEDSDIYGNASGVEVGYGGTTMIRDNRIHNQDHMVDPGVGGQGISFYKTTGSATAMGNQIWSNHMLPGDPTGSDGTGFEIYGASNVVMTGNTLWDNESVLETGTDGPACAHITYTRNVAMRHEAFHNVGLILRCASDTLVAQNVFDGYDKFAFDLSEFEGKYGGSIAGLRIENNVVVNGRMYSIDTAIPSSVVADYNVAYTTDAATALYGHDYVWVVGRDQTRSRAEFTGWTGLGAHDLWGVDPQLDSTYHPVPGSPLIDRGTNLGFPFQGAAPDVGAFEVS